MPDTTLIASHFVRFLRENPDPIAEAAPMGDVDCLLDEVNLLLGRSPFELIEARRISFARPHEVFYPKDSHQLERALKHDTLVLQGLETSTGNIGTLCQSLSDELSRTVAATSYLSSSASQSFGWHSDRWESLIIQLSGKKTFLFRDHDEVALERGSLLMFREQVEHKTQTEGHSIHLSISARHHAKSDKKV